MGHARPLSAKITTGIHRAVYRLSHGRLGGRIGNMPMLLLTTTGRKSGHLRTTPLTYLRRGKDYVVIASNTGKDWAPAWFGNLKANPEATIQVGPKTLDVTAAVAPPEEREWLWDGVVKWFPNYEEYAEKTTREIPIVILHPKE